MAEPLLDVRGMKKYFPVKSGLLRGRDTAWVRAVDGEDFTVFPGETLGILTPGLEDKTLVMRERAAVALGYMGRAAAPAKAQVTKALREASDEREQRLLKWCLREMD